MVRDCAGFIRTKLAREVNLKFTPELHFDYDPSEKDYQRLNTKLNQLKRSGQMGSDKPDEQA
jgi:ribosome-binding factor A